MENKEEKINNIKFYPTDELLEEIKTRFDTLIFFGQKPALKQKDKVISCYHWKGDDAEVIGFCEILKKEMLDVYKMESNREPVEGDE